MGEGCFSGSGGAVEDGAGEAVGGEEAAEELSVAEKVRLADEFFERLGPEPDGEGLDLGKGLPTLIFEQVHVPIIKGSLFGSRGVWN